MKYLSICVAAALLAGCSAAPLDPQAAHVELHSEKPAGNCKSLGEAVGDQGHWATGDYTSNKNLLVGARNTLRNRAAEMGGNYVWLQNTMNASAWGSLGTSSTTVVGMVYSCQ
jgi:hypothetical protein